eukprot:1492335-Prymnesium_polylepis.1
MGCLLCDVCAAVLMSAACLKQDQAGLATHSMTLPGVHRSGQRHHRRWVTCEGVTAMVTVSPSEPIRKASCCVWADPDERLQCCTEVNVPHRAAQSGGQSVIITS